MQGLIDTLTTHVVHRARMIISTTCVVSVCFNKLIKQLESGIVFPHLHYSEKHLSSSAIIIMGDEQLRIARGQKKAAVTRQLGTLERHIAENKSPDVVEAGLVLAAQAFDELGTAHDALAASFATETDISAGEVWFTKAHQEYVTKVKIARQWIDLKSGATGASGPSGNVVTVSQHSPLSRGSGLRDCSLFLTWIRIRQRQQ